MNWLSGHLGFSGHRRTGADMLQAFHHHRFPGGQTIQHDAPAIDHATQLDGAVCDRVAGGQGEDIFLVLIGTNGSFIDQ